MPDSGHDSQKLASRSLHGVYTPPAKLYPVFTPRSVTCRCLQWSPRLPGAHPPFAAQACSKGASLPGRKNVDLVYIGLFAAMAGLTWALVRFCDALSAGGQS